MDPMSGFDIGLLFTLPPRDSKDAYTSEITFLALHPWLDQYASVYESNVQFHF